MLAGVAQGLANRYGIAPWVVRAVFILLAFAGGAGVALYAAGWFLIRSEDETRVPRRAGVLRRHHITILDRDRPGVSRRT